MSLVKRILKWAAIGFGGLLLVVVGLTVLALILAPSEQQSVGVSGKDQSKEGVSDPSQVKEGGGDPSPELQREIDKQATTTPTGLRIERVVDGDSFHLNKPVQGTTEVRLIGIDAPEMGRGNCEDQPMAFEATAYMQIFEGQKVRLEFDEDSKDQYGRLLAYAYTDILGEVMVNEDLVREGLAQTYFVEPNTRYKDRLLKAQEYAKGEEWDFDSIWTLPNGRGKWIADHGNGIGSGDGRKVEGCASTATAPATASPSPGAWDGGGDPNRNRDNDSYNTAPPATAPSTAPPAGGVCEPPAYPVPPGDERDGDGDGCANE
jgi:micrococcal nuclease